MLFSPVFLFALGVSRSGLCAGWVRRRSRCCQFSAGLVKAQPDTQSPERGVTTVEHDSDLRLLVRRTAGTVVA